MASRSSCQLPIVSCSRGPSRVSGISSGYGVECPGFGRGTMTKVLRSVLAIVLLAPLAIEAQSAGKSNSSSSHNSSNTASAAVKGDTREIAGYQLTKDKLLKVSKGLHGAEQGH